MNVLREFTAIIAIAVTTYGQENVVLTPEPHAYFGSQQMPLFYEKVDQTDIVLSNQLITLNIFYFYL